jgi:hypothetical protein
MKKLLLVALAFIALTFARTAFCAEIVGKVADGQGTPITDVKVAINNTAGATVDTTTTNNRGVFAVRNLAPGDYVIRLQPLTGGSLGGVAAFHVPAGGIKFIWRIMPGDAQLAIRALDVLIHATPSAMV